MMNISFQLNISNWVSEKLASIAKHDIVADAVIPELSTFIEIVNMASSHCNPIGIVSKFFNSVNIGYYRVVSFAVEKKVRFMSLSLVRTIDFMTFYTPGSNDRGAYCFCPVCLSVVNFNIHLTFALTSEP